MWTEIVWTEIEWTEKVTIGQVNRKLSDTYYGGN